MCGFLWPKTFLSRKVPIEFSGCDENLPRYNATNASPKHEVMPYQGIICHPWSLKTSLRRAENFLPSQIVGPSTYLHFHILASKHLLRLRNLNACLTEARSWCKGKAWFGREVVSQRKFIHTVWFGHFHLLDRWMCLNVFVTLSAWSLPTCLASQTRDRSFYHLQTIHSLPGPRPKYTSRDLPSL